MFISKLNFIPENPLLEELAETVYQAEKQPNRSLYTQVF